MRSVSDHISDEALLQPKSDANQEPPTYEPPSPKRYFNTRDKCGIFVIVLVYLLMFKIYMFTIIHAMGDGLKQGRATDIVNAILLSIFMMLAVYAHFRCMTTNPGFLPRDYETLDEKNLSHRFYKLI
jgi:hypothetical protein